LSQGLDLLRVDELSWFRQQRVADSHGGVSQFAGCIEVNAEDGFVGCWFSGGLLLWLPDGFGGWFLWLWLLVLWWRIGLWFVLRFFLGWFWFLWFWLWWGFRGVSEGNNGSSSGFLFGVSGDIGADACVKATGEEQGDEQSGPGWDSSFGAFRPCCSGQIEGRAA